MTRDKWRELCNVCQHKVKRRTMVHQSTFLVPVQTGINSVIYVYASKGSTYRKA